MAQRRFLLAVLLPPLLAAGPAAADWLQLHDGSRVQTRGPWEVRGARVVFTLPNGTLGSVPAAQVDLEASARVTREALAPKPQPTPAPRRPAVLTLTDADLAAARGPARAEDAAVGAPPPATASGAAAEPAAASGGGELEVVNWSSRYDAATNTTSVTGTIRNPGDEIRFGIRIEIAAFDGDGGLIARSTVTPLRPGLPPGGTSAFALRLPGAPAVARAEFAFSSERAALRPAAESEPAEATATPTPEAPHRLGSR